MKKRRVVIIGGGTAGLSAAHELIERDFEVTVFERNRILGGKARSVDVHEGAALRADPDRPPKNAALPGEHGFRFFPGWYRHLPDTMKRIPYPKTGKSVFENLVPAELSLLASYNRDPIKAVVKFPISWQQIKLVLKFPKDVVELVPVWDLEFFARKMVQFLVSCEERRLAEFERQTWWDFMEADSRSPEFRQYLVMGATRNTVAAKAQHASAYTIAKMGIQTFTDAVKPGGTVDRVLNGPTNDVWIDPWRVYLEQQGVKFEMGWELDGIVWPENDDKDKNKPKNEIKGVRLTPARDYLKLAEARLATVQFLEDLINAVAGVPLPPRSPRVRRQGSDLLPAVRGKFSRSAREAWAVEVDNVAELQTDAHYAGAFQSLAKNLRAEDSLDVKALQAAFLAENPHCEDDLAKGWEVLRRWKSDPSNRVLKPGQIQKLAAEMTRILQGDRLERMRRDYADDKKRPFSKKDDRELTPRDRTLHAAAFAADHIDYLKKTVDDLRAADMDYLIAEADYFVFALPVEQMAFHVHNSPTLAKHDPNLLNIVALSEHVDWMAGIQFYLQDQANITPGHIDCLDSEWSLTAISQTQFWDDVDLKERGFGDCKSILSVDISSWDTPGGRNQKAAWNCTAQEIAEETWEQLKRALNRPGQPPVLEDEMLCGDPGLGLIPARNYHLDDSIVDRYDRKKQGFYEKFRRVAFDGKALIDRRRDPQRVVDVPEAFGERVQVNAEPLLVNRCGSFFLRPEAKTRVPNMFLAADYVRTFTNLATMEGANEAARAAVNAILKASGIQRPPCDVWRLDEPAEALRLLDKELFERRQKFQDTYGDIPIRLAGAGIKAALGTAEKALDTARGLWKSFRRDS